MTYRTMREPVRPIPSGHVPPARFFWPTEAHLIPPNCGNCGARLLRGNVPTADAPLVDVTCLLCTRVACELQHDGMRPMTAAQFHALPMVQQKRGPKPRQFSPCLDCGTPTRRDGAQRCHPCAMRLRTDLGRIAQLVVLLSDGQRHRRADLALALGVACDEFRKLISRARARGRVIVNDGWGWVRLEVRPCES